MLTREARWFEARLAELEPSAVFPMLNVGSHTERFRTEDQPWIERHVFAPVRDRGGEIKHLDIRRAPGVDIVGDLTDEAFLERLAAMRFRSVFCANLLEHVPNPGEIARALTAVVPSGGYLFVSCPYRFPYHPDPIDTMFRPDPRELAGLFPGTSIHREAIVPCGTAFGYLLARTAGNPRAALATLWKRSAAAGQPESLAAARHLVPWLLRTFRESCLVLRRDA